GRTHSTSRGNGPPRACFPASRMTKQKKPGRRTGKEVWHERIHPKTLAEEAKVPGMVWRYLARPHLSSLLDEESGSAGRSLRWPAADRHLQRLVAAHPMQRAAAGSRRAGEARHLRGGWAAAGVPGLLAGRECASPDRYDVPQ